MKYRIQKEEDKNIRTYAQLNHGEYFCYKGDEATINRKAIFEGKTYSTEIRSGNIYIIANTNIEVKRMEQIGEAVFREVKNAI